MTPNDGFEYVERVGPEADGTALLAYLTRRYTHSSEAEWRSRIESGLVRLGGAAVPPHTVMRPGQTLTWSRPPWVEPSAPEHFGLLHEDAQMVGVDKPAGMPTLPGAHFLTSSLLYRVRGRFPDAAPVHRLGRWTSGVVLFARTLLARAVLCRQWSNRTVLKRYRALAYGDPAWDEIRISASIGPVPHSLLGSVHAVSDAGKPASSHVRVLERRRGSFLCDVLIETGRPHQVRIHLAAAGHPLLGDPLYPPGGVPALGARAVPGDPGYQLHAAALAFLHPGDGRPVVIESPPPAVLRPLGSR